MVRQMCHEKSSFGSAKVGSNKHKQQKQYISANFHHDSIIYTILQSYGPKCNVHMYVADLEDGSFGRTKLKYNVDWRKLVNYRIQLHVIIVMNM